jgi:hypothetical protein
MDTWLTSRKSLVAVVAAPNISAMIFRLYFILILFFLFGTLQIREHADTLVKMIKNFPLRRIHSAEVS